ncbi:MAG: hypothetical protein Kow0068_14540 [Marinilabiliales bacterium]
MKKVILNILLVLIITIYITSCKTASISVKVLKPADITIPPNIKTLAVVNRSLPGEGEHFNNIVEGVLTGEGLFADREASGNTVAGVADALLSSPRFKVTVPTGIDLRGTGTAKWPEPLSWDQVKKICKDYNADALICLETFDSNIGRSISSKEQTRTVDGKTEKYMEFLASIDVAIEAGWRIYDPKNKQIVDQSVFTDHKGFSAKGLSEEEANKKLPIARLAVKDAGHFAGTQYAYRISPMWVWVSRRYYKKGNEDFVAAKYNVKANQWEEAIEKWKKHVNNPDPKIAGYACFNMALGAEIFGDLETAAEWAKKSYSNYKIKKALGYLRVLEQRIRDEQRLKEQMKTE